MIVTKSFVGVPVESWDLDLQEMIECDAIPWDVVEAAEFLHIYPDRIFKGSDSKGMVWTVSDVPIPDPPGEKVEPVA